MPRIFRASALAVCLAVFGCSGGGGGPKAPTTPNPPTTPSTPTVSSVTVTGPATSPRVGESAQFTATAVMSNGTTQTVTSQATWQSTNSGVATVTAGGVVAAVGAGETDIRATYQTATGTVRVTVTISTVNVCGVLRDSANNAGLSNGEVEILDGQNIGKKAPSDGTGAYCLNTLQPGTFTLRARRTGYDTSDQTVTANANATVNFSMRASGGPGPGPNPGPTPTPGPNGPTCTAASIPSSATCIGNGTPPVTAVCQDGAFSCSANRTGTCSTHGGVKCWVCPGALCNGFADAAPLDYTPVPWPTGGKR